MLLLLSANKTYGNLSETLVSLIYQLKGMGLDNEPWGIQSVIHTLWDILQYPMKQIMIDI